MSEFSWIRAEETFIYPEEKERFDWKGILGPCQHDIAWKYRNINHGERPLRTSARESLISNYEINPAGFYTKFTMITRTEAGVTKKVGGDFWRAYLTGAGYQNGVVYDLKDGTYEIWFHIKDPGNYTLNLILEFSLCDGLRDPPAGWFERGNANGRFQEEGILGYLDEYLVQKTMPIHFEVKLPKKTGLKQLAKFRGHNQSQCVHRGGNRSSCFTSKDFDRKCMFVWDGYGNWKPKSGSFRWKPNFPVSKPANYNSKKKLDTLWFLGDSVTYRLWDSSYTRVLCRQAFKNCKKTYTWVYEIGKSGEKKRPNNVGLAFNKTKFFAPLYAIFNQPDMKSNRSVVVINFGLHIIMTLNFSDYKILIKDFIKVLDHYRALENQTSVPQIIWKTTTMSHKENTERWNVTQARFLTNHRISLFNAYTNSELCSAGVTILDIYPISASYHKGTRDHVHYEYFVFEPVEDVIADFVWKNYNI